MSKINSKNFAIDWRFPLIVFCAYSFSCYIFESLFDVPGSISFESVCVFSLPYISISFALYSFRSMRLFLDPIHLNRRLERDLISIKYSKLMVTFSFGLQIITWFYINSNFDQANNLKDFFYNLREASIDMNSIVPIWLSYPNGLCFASFCLALACYRSCKSNINLFFTSIAVLSVFLNDLQTSGRAGMVFVVFVLFVCSIWDFIVAKRSFLPMFMSIFLISIFTQLPKVLRSGYRSSEDFLVLIKDVFRYCFSYLNTLTDLLNRMPDPNWIGERTFLPIYNLVSRFSPLVQRSAIHSIERSPIWGFNNYTIAGDLARDFSYIGCIVIPFFFTLSFLYFASQGSRTLNISISLFFSGWLLFGTITNVLMLGGFFASIVFLFSLSFLERVKSAKI